MVDGPYSSPRTGREADALLVGFSGRVGARLGIGDDRAILVDDPDAEEDRFVLLGLSAGLKTLVVCHCYGEDEHTIRIISARKAHREERGDYERRWRR